MKKRGVEGMKLGVDFVDINMVQIFKEQKIDWVDGMTPMMEARAVKNVDEQECMRMVGAIGDAAHWETMKFLKPGLTENQVNGLIKDIQVPDLGDDGQPIERPARLSDRFKKPFPNAVAAAVANNGKAPPDLSVIVKAREGGADYIHGLLTGYVPFDKLTAEQKKEFDVTKDDNFNKYFPGHKIGMPPPLADDKVTYADGTKATLDQEAADVTEFLAWAAEPHMEDRKRTGVRVILFLLAMAGLMYAVKRQVWADKH